MENDLVLNVQQIIVKQGSVEFPEFENIKNQAVKLASRIEKVEVNDENIKESKKLLATVNNRLKELEDKRISIKKMMLEPYQEFEIQVKEIVGIVKEAENEVRKQVKYLEEFERLQKEESISDIFAKRIHHYKFKDLFSFRDFLQPKHLNKTTSIKAIENEMVEFLEKIAKDLEVIQTIPDSQEVLSAYIESKDLAGAISIANENKQRKEQIKASKVMQEPTQEKSFHFIVFSKKDFMLVEMFMKQNTIKFNVEDGF